MGEREKGMTEWRRDEKERTITCFLPSTEEMYRRVEATGRVSGALTSSTKGGNSSWTGGMSFSDSAKAAREGWLEGAEKVREALARIRLGGSQLVGEARKLVHSVAGSRVDLGAYQARRPNHMIKKRRVRTNDGSIIKVGVECMASCSVSGDAMIARAVALATVVAAIESTGVSIEIIGLSSWKCQDPGAYIVGHVVKKAAFPINLERMVFGLGHPSVTRRGVFGVLERCTTLKKAWTNSIGYGYGSGGNADLSKVRDAMGLDYMVPGFNTGDESEKDWSSSFGMHWNSDWDKGEKVDQWCRDMYNAIFAVKMKG